MKKRITSILLLIVFAACFMTSPVQAAVAGKTTVEVINNDGTVFKTWEYSKPGDALNQLNKVLGGSVSGLPAESKRYVKLTLGSDWSHDSQITFSKPVTLDLNGHAVIRTRKGKKKDNGSVFKVNKGGVLTIVDSNPNSPGYDSIPGGVITGGASKNSGGGIHVGEYGKLVMKGGTIYDCSSSKHGGGILADKHAEVYVDGAKIYKCRTNDSGDDCHGGAIMVEDDSCVEVTNSTIDSCYSEDSGGAIFTNRGMLALRNVLFTGNRAKDNGGAVSIWHETKDVTIENCTFTNNRCDSEDGGGLHINDNIKGYKPLIVNGCVFKGNYAGDKGGGIYIDAHGVVLLDVTVTGNKCKNEGGGVWVDSEHDVNVSGVIVIKDNKSEKKSGRGNLCLQKTTDSFLGVKYDSHQAYIFNGGLMPGSDIRVSSSKGGKVRIAKEDSFTAYQTRYISADRGELIIEQTKVVNAPLIGTIAGKGSLVLIGSIMIGLSVLAAAGVIFVMNKNRKGEDLDGETED